MDKTIKKDMAKISKVTKSSEKDLLKKDKVLDKKVEKAKMMKKGKC